MPKYKVKVYPAPIEYEIQATTQDNAEFAAHAQYNNGTWDGVEKITSERIMSKRDIYLHKRKENLT